MEVRNSLTSVFIDAFTQNTYILVVLSDPSIRTSVLSVRVSSLDQLTRPFFVVVVVAGSNRGDRHAGQHQEGHASLREVSVI
jgi:hypothetical protein